ncbi:MAG: triose-phosphate isomerase [bacterium]
MRRPIIAGNWKMNKTVGEAVALASGLREKVADVEDRDVVICPAFTALGKVAEAIKGSNIALGAQDMHWEDSGAFTGEISPTMLKDVGCRYVIIGHSERRTHFGETNDTVNRKVEKALERGLTPIMCVGERLEEREAGKTFDVVRDHIEGGLRGLSPQEVQGVVIAYEPVWAIGTGRTATPDQAEEVHEYIRRLLAEAFGEDVAERVRIQYGGSVRPDNIDDLMAQPDIDGALVGGASLKVEDFARIVKFTSH